MKNKIEHGTVFLWRKTVCVAWQYPEIEGLILYATNPYKKETNLLFKQEIPDASEVAIIKDAIYINKAEIMQRIADKFTVLMSVAKDKSIETYEVAIMAKLRELYDYFGDKDSDYKQLELIIDYVLDTRETTLPRVDDLMDVIFKKQIYKPTKDLREELTILCNTWLVYDNVYDDKFDPEEEMDDDDYNIHNQVIGQQLKGYDWGVNHNDIHMDFENWDETKLLPEKEEYDGYHVIDINGEQFEFMSCQAGGDGLNTVDIIYYVRDGKYHSFVIDSKYNSINKDTMEATHYGYAPDDSEWQADAAYIQSLGFEGVTNAQEFDEYTEAIGDEVIDADYIRAIKEHITKIQNDESGQ